MLKSVFYQERKREYVLDVPRKLSSVCDRESTCNPAVLTVARMRLNLSRSVQALEIQSLLVPVENTVVGSESCAKVLQLETLYYGNYRILDLLGILNDRSVIC